MSFNKNGEVKVFKSNLTRGTKTAKTKVIKRYTVDDFVADSDLSVADQEIFFEQDELSSEFDNKDEAEDVS